jgi:hypothetical protein
LRPPRTLRMLLRLHVRMRLWLRLRLRPLLVLFQLN